MTDHHTALFSHLASGATSVCRAWGVERRDGEKLGFTDHDNDLAFEGFRFRADSGMTAKALQQTMGLSVDNTEAIGALNSAAVTEIDLMSGRYDGAEVRAWLVNWKNVEERVLQFRGTMGEITRSGGAFRAELRGQTDALNQPQGRVYQRGCSAILGDVACGFDLNRSGYSAELPIETLAERRLFRFSNLVGFGERWFERGKLTVLSGAGRGLVGQIKNDTQVGTYRSVELWEQLGTNLATGDLVRLEPGCDKLAETCRAKFNNFLNFRGFPHVPGEDWLISYPVSAGLNDGGKLT
jgi:uncharacterized phage protein (TIGR02218 family)